MKTESRDRKQKEAAAAFVVAEECGNVEALCQTFLKWGQVTFSQRGKATTTTKKSGGEGGKRHCCSRFSPPEPTVRGAGGRGGAWAGGAGPGGGSGRSSLRGWDVRGAAGAAEPRVGLRRGGGCGRGGRRGRRPRGYLCGPRPGSDPRAGSWGAQSFLPRDSPLPFKESFEWSVRGSALAAVPSASTPWGSRHLFNSWQEASGPAVRGR